MEDDKEIRDGVEIYLKNQGYQVWKAANGKEGLEIVAQEEIHLAILDIMMPVMDGVTMLMKLREQNHEFPVIMLSAKSEEVDKIMGLNMGADDYVTKPFSPKELVLRVASVLKRCEHTPGSVIAEYGPFTFDKNALKFYIDNEEVDLTATEFKLMIHMVEREGQTLNRNDLLSCVWGYSHQAQSRTLDTHMKRLRQKLAPYADCIETVRSIGYRFTLPGRRIPEEKA